MKMPETFLGYEYRFQIIGKFAGDKPPTLGWDTPRISVNVGKLDYEVRAIGDIWCGGAFAKRESDAREYYASFVRRAESGEYMTVMLLHKGKCLASKTMI